MQRSLYLQHAPTHSHNRIVLNLVLRSNQNLHAWIAIKP